MKKITIIGGGSYSWGPTFLKDIFITPALRGSTVMLHDIDPQRMDLVYALGQKMLLETGADYRLEKSLSLEQALAGADFIILTITTGGLESMRHDLEIPERYGIRQAVGDTVGPGGLSRALRNIPVLDAIGRKVLEICPQALFLNYTNPLSVLTRTLSRLGVRVVGLCHEYIGVRNRLAELYGVEPGAVQARVAGINHLIWITALQIAGRDVWSEIPALAEAILAGRMVVDAEDTSVFADHARVKARLCQLYGALPAAGDRHIAEFFPFFLSAARSGVGEDNPGGKYGIRLTSISDRQVLMAEARGLIEAALRGDQPLAPFMAELSGEAAGPIMAAVVSGGQYTGIMNLPNTGQISGLPLLAVVETFGVIDALGPRPLGFGAFPPGIEAVLAQHVANQELTVQAALSGSHELALQVLLNDPLSHGLHIDQAAQMLADLLQANREVLPQFWGE